MNVFLCASSAACASSVLLDLFLPESHHPRFFVLRPEYLVTIADIMYFLALLALTAWSSASPLSENSFFTKTTAGLRARSLRITSHVAELQRLSGAGQPSSKYLRTATCTNVMTSGTPNVTANRTLYGQADLISADLGQVFITNVSFGSQVFEAVIDTGSSDTWLVEAGFTCVNQTSNITVTEADCLFGSAGYKPDSTFTPIPDENFNVSYADGEYLNGIMGYDKVTFAGITIQKQGKFFVMLCPF